MRILLTLMFCFSISSTSAKSLALTFDDGLNPEVETRASAWNVRILGGLQASAVQAMFFPALSLVGGAEGQALVMQWSRAGHAIGNHTSKHRNLGSSKLSLAEFVTDIRENEKIFGGYPTWKPMLRFPYLKEGDTAEKRDGMRSWLATNGYRSAPVSIDTSDWYYNEVWLELQSRGETVKLDSLRQAYIKHLLARATYYDALANTTINRSPLHVMLLHVNAINANCITEVVRSFKDAGWDFVTPEQAFKDKIYQRHPDVLPAGESIIWSLARSSEANDLRYPAEDSLYEEAGLRAEGLIP